MKEPVGLALVLLFLLLNSITSSNLVFGELFHAVVPTDGQVRPLLVLSGEGEPFALVCGGVAVWYLGIIVLG